MDRRKSLNNYRTNGDDVMKLIDRVNNCIAITGSGFYATSLLTELINVYIEMEGDMGILCDEIK